MAGSDFAARYLRQIIVTEVGKEGQHRLTRAVAPVGPAEGGLQHACAIRYAKRVGFAGIEDGAIVLDELAPSAIVKNAACRAVLAGSRAALTAMRDVVLAAPSDSGGASDGD